MLGLDGQGVDARIQICCESAIKNWNRRLGLFALRPTFARRALAVLPVAFITISIGLPLAPAAFATLYIFFALSYSNVIGLRRRSARINLLPFDLFWQAAPVRAFGFLLLAAFKCL